MQNDSSGGQLGLDLRSGKVTMVGSTRRIQQLNGMMHAKRPSVDIHRSQVYTKVFKETEGQPQIRRRYKAAAELFRTATPVIYDHEMLAGWAASVIRGVQIPIERHADWLADELDILDSRTYDPFEITEEDKEILRKDIIPYWKDKTAASYWRAYVSDEEAMNMTSSGFSDVTNYLTTYGDHFAPDIESVLKTGLKGRYETAKKQLESLDPLDPDSIDKKEFYQDIMEVLLAVKTFAENYAEAAEKKAHETADKTRAHELMDMAACIRNVPWNPAESFYEAIETTWLMYCLIYMEEQPPALTLGRADQYLWPYYEKDIREGNITPEQAMEYIEELYIKITACPYFMSSGLAYYFGGYYPYPHLDVGGLNVYRQDASNELSYLFLRAMRHVKTTGPTVSLLLHQKTSDDLLAEAVKLAAEGMGHPSFFDVETMNNMLRGRGGGPEGKSLYTEEEILKSGCTLGCVEPGVAGKQFGHTDASIVNIAYASILALTNGIKPEKTEGYGAGKRISIKTGDVEEFKTFDAYMSAVKKHIEHGIHMAHKNAIIIQRIYRDKFQLPLFSAVNSGGIEKGIDIGSGSAKCMIGPCIQFIGFATLIDSLSAVKKVVFDDQECTLNALKTAIENNFDGYDALRNKLCEVPHYGNDDDYADSLAVEIWDYFATTVKKLKNNFGNYIDPAVQMVQANVGFGALTGATPNGRLSGEPLSDCMSASQQADVKGTTAAARSYGKLNYPLYSNGTLLNMWISGTELVEAN